MQISWTNYQTQQQIANKNKCGNNQITIITNAFKKLLSNQTV